MALAAASRGASQRLGRRRATIGQRSHVSAAPRESHGQLRLRDDLEGRGCRSLPGGGRFSALGLGFRRRISGPIYPRLTVVAVVEQFFVTQQFQPLLLGGVQHRFPLGIV